MDEGDRQARIEAYTRRLKALHRQVLAWLAPTTLTATTQHVHLNEYAVGGYHAPMLLLRRGVEDIASLRPVGLAIIGACGRTDLIGALDVVQFIYLLKGGGSLTTTVSAGDRVLESTARPLFQGVTREGWYWIESKQLGTAKLVNRDLFFESIARVSDYEAR